MNVSMFIYNTTVSSNSGVACHVWMQSDATRGLDVPYTLCRVENNVPLDWGHDGRETTSLQEYERSTRWKSKAEEQGRNLRRTSP